MNVAEFTAPVINWLTIAPIIAVLGGGVVGILVEALAPAHARRPLGIAIGIISMLAALALLIHVWPATVGQPSMNAGEVVFDTQSVLVQMILVLVGLLAFLVIVDRTSVKDGAFAGQPSDRPGSHEEELTLEKGYQRTEIFPLVLLSLGGMMVFPVANSFIALFVALEVMSLPLYILAATARRRRQVSHEAALKYFILGAFASGFMLMGMAFIYGVVGTLTISEITPFLMRLAQAAGAPEAAALNIMLEGGILLVMVGLLFKVGAAPFHAWTPDVYTGAPTPVTGFMAAAVKISAFAAMLRFYQTIGAAMHGTLLPVYIGIIVLTIVVGTFAGLVQTDIKRMLAFSSVAHTGYILLGVFAASMVAVFDVFFYLLAYGLATIGVFALVTLVRSTDAEGNILGEVTDFRRWAGLGRKHPIFGAAVTLFLLSFAGIPLTSGFVGKFLLFKDAVSAGMGWVVVIALISSVITAFFYFRVIRVLFFEDANDDIVLVAPEGFATVSIVVAVLGTIILGVFPSLALSLVF